MSNPSNEKTDFGSGLISWFAGNHVAANILMVFLIVGGLFKATTMVRETFPAIDPKLIQVSVPYPGATPEDVESSITRRIEEAVIGIQGVDRVNSTAREGLGLVQIELNDFVDSNEILSEVETEIDRLTDFPPEEAEEVSIVRLKPEQDVLSLVVYGDTDPLTLRTWAETIEDQILQLPSTSLVDISGSPDREISIEIPEEKLREHNLSLKDIADQISAFSLDIPAGTLRTENSEILLRVQQRKYFGFEFADIPIISARDGSKLRLETIADIRDSFEDIDYASLYNGYPALFIDIKRSAAQDTLIIEEEVQGLVAKLRLPPEIKVGVWKNQTINLKERINLLARNALMGLALVFMILVLFLDLKLAVWTAIGIPISFLGGILIASMFGVSINMISLFALIVVLGIVVDDAIVAGESIFSEQKAGKVGRQAALDGIWAILAPVTIGVLTTIAVFVTLGFSTGVLGQILQPIPIIVSSVLFVSLIEAFLILPAHLSSSNRWSIGPIAMVRNAVTRGLERCVDSIIVPITATFIKARYFSLILLIVIPVMTFSLFSNNVLRFVFFPNIETDEISVALEMEDGTPYDVTEQHILNILEAGKTVMTDISDQDLIENTSLVIGGRLRDSGGPAGGSSASSASHLAQITVELIPSDLRTASAAKISRKWQEAVGDIPMAQNITFTSSLIHGGADITIELTHRDNNILDKASEELKQRMKQISGLAEVADSLEDGKKEFVFELNDVGKAYGLTPALLGSQLREIFYGREIDRLQRGRNEIQVMVRYPRAQRETLSILEDIRITLPNGHRTPLKAVTTISETFSPTTITRVDGRRIVNITADTDITIITPDIAIGRIVSDIIPDLKERYPGLSYQLGGQSQDQRDDLQTLFRNFTIAMMVIFVLLASQLRSYVKPVIILSAIPLGISGAALGHLLLGQNLSFISMFGMTAMAGVVINDSVVLVDYYNKKREQGRDAFDAAIRATRRRFRPILLTTLTTALGLLPMLLETSLQARFIIPMAVSLAFGLAFASALLIFIVPALLKIVDDFEQFFARFTSAQPEAA